MEGDGVMDKTRWDQIKKGMETNGWKAVFSMHPDLPRDIKDDLTKDYQNRYNERYWDHQWYHSHNAYKFMFVRRKAQAVPSVEDNAYRKPIIDRLDRQTAKGINEYKQVISTNKAPLLHRLEETQKELTDGLVYNEWVIDGLINLGKHLAQLRTHLVESHSKVHGIPLHNPIRVNSEKAINMIDNIIGEVGKIGKSE